MSLKKQAISGMSWTLLQQFGISGIGFLVQIVLARLIAPEEFGLFGLLLIFNIIGNTLANSGMGSSLIRSDNLEDDDYGTVFLTNLGISLIIYFIILAFGPLIAKFYNQPILSKLISVYSLSIIISSFSSIQVYRLSKSLNFKKQAIIQVPSAIISGVIGIILGYLDYGVWALVIMQVVLSFVMSFQYWLFTGWRPKLIFNKQKFKQHFNFGYKITLSSLLTSITNNIVPMIIGKFFTTAQVGFYTRADSMKNFPIFSLTSALDKVTYPLFVQVKNDEEKLKSAYIKAQDMVLFVLSPFIFFLVLAAHPIFDFLLGSIWLPAVSYFQLLCIVGLTYPIVDYKSNLLKVKGRSDQILTASFINKSLLLIGIIATVKFGIIPIIYSLIFNAFFSIFILTIFASKHLSYSIGKQWWDLIKSIIPSLATFILIYFLTENYIQIEIFHNLIQIIFYGLSYFIVYLMIQFLLKSLALKESLNLIHNSINRVKQHRK